MWDFVCLRFKLAQGGRLYVKHTGLDKSVDYLYQLNELDEETTAG